MSCAASPNSRRLALAAALFCVALLVAIAEPAAGQESNFDLEGTISHQEPGKLTIDTGDNIIFHATYAADTPISHADGKPASKDDLKIGVKVHIAGDLQESGEVKSQKIEIEDSRKDSAAGP